MAELHSQQFSRWGLAGSLGQAEDAQNRCEEVPMEMIRREFIAVVGAVMASWRTTARAQQRFRIGLLDTGLGATFFVPFMRKLTELGYVEGRNLALERKSAEGNV